MSTEPKRLIELDSEAPDSLRALLLSLIHI